MRWIAIISWAVLTCLAASAASAGRIFGDIMLDGKPVPAGLELNIILVPPPSDSRGAELKPQPSVIDSTVTDEFGSYKLTVKEEGKCILQLVYEEQSPALEIFSYRDATRYDLILERRDGILSLRRK